MILLFLVSVVFKLKNENFDSCNDIESLTLMNERFSGDAPHPDLLANLTSPAFIDALAEEIGETASTRERPIEGVSIIFKKVNGN